MITLRLGLPKTSRRYVDQARELGAPIMISANACRGRRGFNPPKNLEGVDAALDSAGFVAMMRYGGFPWSVRDYVELAGALPWAWWASMDLCCEPQIARDRATVRCRQERTLELLVDCREEAERQDVPPPMPVLQGWLPDDYARAVDRIRPKGLTGVGSVCRRSVRGVLAVVDRLERCLPPSASLHLFGVKGEAMRELRGHPLVASTDSMAWDFAARFEAPSFTVANRCEWMRQWWTTQRAALDAPASPYQPELGNL